MLGRLICVAGLLAVVACSAPSPGSLNALFSPSKHGPVDDLLDRRTQAFRKGDEAQYLADLDRGQAALVQRERMMYDNLRQLTFSEFHYRQFFPPDIAKPITLHDGQPVDVLVVLSYRLTGIDTGATQEGFDYTFVSKNGKPVITRIDYDTLGSSNHTIPWNLVPLRVARSGNVTVAADPTAGDPAPIAGAISAADQQVRKVWAGRPAAPGTLVFTSRDTRQAHSWLFVPMSAAVESAAFVVPVAGYDDRNQALDDTVGGRMVMVVGTAPPDQVDGMYRHELTHAISAPVVRQGRDTPIWAIEGFAAWVEDPSGSVARSRLAWVRRAVRQGTFTGRLPDNQTFYAQPDITLHYALGLTVFKFVSERWTSEKAVDLYEEVVTGHSLGDATTKVLALDEATFLQQWSTYVRQLPA